MPATNMRKVSIKKRIIKRKEENKERKYKKVK